MSAHARPRCRSRTTRILRVAVRHPYRTCRRADDELTQRTSFGLWQTVALFGFVLTIDGWVAVQIAHVLLSR
ncbi:hypothetical protein [Streptomyces odontomachi]|uniref:hypothetical protein n=1 Tax=Streptomyces odontomachi TaxID=2944940 RepID=UPI00210EAE78|nr:hypothetical protein [Streptomyces sp. ODS25]